MEVKKNPQADVDKVRASVFFGGLAFALALILVIFQLTFWDVQYSSLAGTDFEAELEEEILVTQPEVKPPPPPPKPTVIIEIVEDDEEVEETEIEIEEVDVETEIEYIEEEEEVIEEQEIFKIVEKMPEFPGGEEELFKYLGKNIKYPAMARDAGISGRVFVTFVVEKNGDIKDCKVLRGIGGGCDEEALRVVKKMPNWKAGQQRGKPVRVQFNLPIFFNLK
jgi:protein TonB